MIVDDGKYYLYRHVRLDKNEVFYVGIGTANKVTRYKRAKAKNSRSSFWKNIVRKTEYRIDIIFETDCLEFLWEKEIEFIALYGRKDLGTGTLTNLSNGAEGNFGLILPEELINQKIKRMTGRKVSSETRKKISNTLTGTKLSSRRIAQLLKKINQFDIEGNLITTWESIKAATEALYIDRSRISYCLKFPHLIIGDSYWRVFKENEIKIEVLYRKDRKRVGLIENGVIIKKYETIKEAANDLKLNSSKISNVCSGKRKHTGGYKFQYL